MEISTKKQTFTTPMAIVVAGALIALAVFFSGSGGGSGAGAEQEKRGFSRELYVDIAKDLKIKEKDFTACLDNVEEMGPLVTEDFNSGRAIGVTGTPFVAVVVDNGSVFSISGAQEYETIRGVVEQALASTPNSGNQTIAENIQPVNESDHVRGKKDARISLIEYSDFECPFCARIHPRIQRVLDEYPNDVNWVYRHFPLSIHRNAGPAAIASECVAQLKGNDAFWEFGDELFANQ